MNHLKFVNDVVLKSTDFWDLQGLLTDLKQAVENKGLNMNMDKSKIITTEQIRVQVVGKVLEKVLDISMYGT